MTQFAPLTGIRILDFTRLLPGPWATAVAADLGATVLKVELGTRGDYSRFAPPLVDGQSMYFENVNAGKHGIRVDLTDPADRTLLDELVDGADVLAESFRPGTMTKMGLGYERTNTRNPALVYCSLTGFGQTGPYARAAGHDVNIVGTAGYLWSGGAEPVMPGVQVADFAGATALAMAILAGVLESRRTGAGTWLDVSMLDGLLSWGSTVYAGAQAAMAGSDDTRRVESFGANPRYGAYRCRDGRWVTVALLETKLWQRFCRHVGREDLINPDEAEADRLSSHGAYGEHYRVELTRLFAQRDRDEWVKELTAQNLPCFPAYTAEEVWADAHVAGRHMLRPVTDAAHHVLSGPVRTASEATRGRPADGFRAIGKEEARAMFAARRAQP